MAQDYPRELDKPPMVSEKALMAAIWAGFGVAALLCCFRYAVRMKHFRRFFADDALVLLALIILAVSAALYHFTVPGMYTIVRVRAGIVAPPANILAISSRYMKMQMAITTLFWTCLWAVKFAFLAFFHKLGHGLRYQRILWNIVVAVTVVTYIGCIISYPISCPTFEADRCNTPLHIRRSMISLRFSTGVDVVTDALIIGLPINLIWRVRMNIREKLALGSLLSLGFIVMVFAIVRVCVLNRTKQHPELTWLALWSSIESSVAVLVSCLASFKTLFARSQQPEYMYGSGGTPGNRRKRTISLGDQGHHLCSIQAGGSRSQKRPHDSSGGMSSEEDFPKEVSGVHVETHVEVLRQ